MHTTALCYDACMICIGIDEAGRGALAGPVSVGVVLLKKDIAWADVPGLKDSKKLSAKKRDEWFAWIVAHADIAWAVGFSSAEIIDTDGIVPACNGAATRAAHRVALPSVPILLDAGLKVLPYEAWDQSAIVRGDETEVAIALASIVAKVSRDRLMIELSKAHPSYGFEIHKGYGTQIHRDRIAKLGREPGVHRVSFTRSLTKPRARS